MDLDHLDAWLAGELPEGTKVGFNAFGKPRTGVVIAPLSGMGVIREYMTVVRDDSTGALWYMTRNEVEWGWVWRI